MARKGCFEVTKLEFTFYYARDEFEKAKYIEKGIKEFVKKNSLSTEYNILHKKDVYGSTDVVVKVEFQESVSLYNIYELIEKLIGVKSHQLIFNFADKEMRVSVHK